MIYCLTQHHTGTWSTLAWILNHQRVQGFLTTQHIFDILEPSEPYQSSGVYPVHPMESGELVEEFHPSMVYHEHIRLDPEKPERIDRSQVLIATVTPTVIPIRDPLLALISYQNRAEKANRTSENGFAPRSHVDSWVALAQTCRKTLCNFAHVKYISWDLIEWDPLKTRSLRHLLEVASALGLDGDVGPSFDCVENVIHNNNGGNYELKQAFQSGDFAYIKKNISQDAVTYLQEKQGTMIPFLESLGYRDLMWWT